MASPLRFGLDVPTTGAYADARVLAQLAAEAEAAGWDGFFIWDVLTGDAPVVDPWIALTAVALATTRIRLGLMVLPLARHRPWLAARRLANLDQLSRGRMICTVGLGYQDKEFTTFGEEHAPAVRARKLDEGLVVLTGLWGSEPFAFTGEHYRVDPVNLFPKPVQSPRIPIWVAGGWPHRAPFRRAARWDGVCLKSVHAETRQWLTLDDLRACLAYVRAQTPLRPSFDVVMSGEIPEDPGQARETMQAFGETGATWWVDEGLGWSFDEFRSRVRLGPPRL